jgi:hypothetical protein
LDGAGRARLLIGPLPPFRQRPMRIAKGSNLSQEPLFQRERSQDRRRPRSAILSDMHREQEVVMAMEERETGTLIGSDKVESTAVYCADRQNIGSIQRVMIDKVSGQLKYAVLSFGGFLGMGSDYYPLPWQSLKYDTSLGGYLTNITEDRLRGAPKYSDENSWSWSDPARTRSVNDYYGNSVW